MPDVFISYSRRDSEEFVQRLNGALADAGLDVWVDLEDIPAASDWERDLKDGVLESEAFCFVISPGSVASVHCLNELGEAESRKKRMVPVIHRSVEDREVPPALRRLNWIPQRGHFEDDFDRNVQTLVEAIRTDQEALRAHTRWEREAAEWETGGRNSGQLLHGAELHEAEDWITAQTGREPQPTALQVEYVSASRRAATRRQRMIVGASLAALVISIVLGIAALLQRNEARDQRDRARANELAATALAYLENDPEVSLMLALEAAELSPSARSEQALARALSASRVRVTVPGVGEGIQARQSPDGRWLVTGTSEGATLYDAASGRRLTALGGDLPVYDLVFAPDSSSVFMGAEDGVVRQFTLPDGDQRREFEIGDPVSSVAIDGSGNVLAATTQRGEIELRDLSSGVEATLPGHDAAVVTVDFARSGPLLISAGEDETTRIWNVVEGEQVGVLRGPSTSRDADVTEDGRTAVTVGFDGRARVWDVAAGEERGASLNDLFSLGRAQSVDLARDERSALVSGQAGGAEIIDLETREPSAAFGGELGIVRSAEFGANGRSVVTMHESSAEARIFDADSVATRLAGSRLDAVLATSADGAVIAGGTYYGHVILSDARTGEATGAFRASQKRIFTIALSADGTRVAAGGRDGFVRIWDVADPASPQRIGQPLAHGGPVYGVAFSPDASRLVSASLDGVARIWDIESGEATAVVDRGQNGVVLDADWSADGKLVAVSSDADGAGAELALVDTETEATVSTSEVPAPGTVAFDPAGEHVVSGGLGGLARITSTSGEGGPVELELRGGQIESARFTADGDQVVTSSPEGTRVWSASSGLLLGTVSGASTDALPMPDGSVAVVERGPPVQIYECEICTRDLDEMIALARERITREPTESERDLYGLD